MDAVDVRCEACQGARGPRRCRPVLAAAGRHGCCCAIGGRPAAMLAAHSHLTWLTKGCSALAPQFLTGQGSCRLQRQRWRKELQWRSQ
jgi:hypothetical protein